jgi:hypothetical protein
MSPTRRRNIKENYLRFGRFNVDCLCKGFCNRSGGVCLLVFTSAGEEMNGDKRHFALSIKVSIRDTVVLRLAGVFARLSVDRSPKIVLRKIVLGPFTHHGNVFAMLNHFPVLIEKL